MPWFMDIHRNVEGVTARDVEEAHVLDIDAQDKYGVRYHKYWFNEDAGTVFCLAEGPDQHACEQVHLEAHGMAADAIIQVDPQMVESFLGEIQTSGNGTALRPDGSLDSAFRVILVSRVANLPVIASRSGDDAAMELLDSHHACVRRALEECSGREVRDTGEGLMATFVSASRALRCAMAIQTAAVAAATAGTPAPQVGIGLSAGEPVERDENLFGVSVNLARRLCERAEPGEILVSDAVRELSLGKGIGFVDRGSAHFRGFDTPVLLYQVEVKAEGTASSDEPSARSSEEADAERAPLESRLRHLAAISREMKRRKVFRVAAVYLAVSFVVLQAASLTFRPLGLPRWCYTLILVLVILGFPLALVMAWALEMTPEGLRRDRGDAGS